MHDQFSLRLSPGAGWPSAEDTELIEFMDEEGRLLLVAPRPEAVRLGLRHKLVGVALRVDGGRFLIRRRTSLAWPEGRLDLSGVAYVRPGEAWEDAALRSLGLPRALSPTTFFPSKTAAASRFAAEEPEDSAVPSLTPVAAFSQDEPPRRQVTVYLATSRRVFLPGAYEGSDGNGEATESVPNSGPSFGPGSGNEPLLLDRDELEGLAVHSPELLTPGLLWTLRSGCLWPKVNHN